MNRTITVLAGFFLILCAAGAVFAQQDDGQNETNGENGLLLAYQRNFARGNLSTKIQILQDAGETGDGEMGELYLQALDFFLDNTETLGEDATALELAKLATQLIGQSGYREGITRLWVLFERSENTEVRVTVMHALGSLLRPEDEVLAEVERDRKSVV